MVKHKDTKKPEAETEEVTKLPTKEDVLSTIKKISKLDATIAGERGQIGGIIQQAEDKKNIHREALKFAAKTSRKDRAKAEEFLRHVAAYLGYLGFEELNDLFEGSSRDKKKGHGDGDKVVDISRPASAQA